MKLRQIFYFIASLLLLVCCDTNEVNFTAMSDAAKEAPQDVVNPNYVPIDWDHTEILEADTTTGRFVLSANADTRKIVRGSVITVCGNPDSYIRIVLDAKEQGNKIVMRTIEGSLNDIFANTSFALVISDDESRAADDETVVTYRALKKGEYDEEGRFRWTVIKNAEPIEWKGLDLDGYELYSDKKSKIYFSEANAGVNMGYIILLNFGIREKHLYEDMHEVVELYRSRTVRADVTTTVNFFANAVVKGEIKSSITKVMPKEIKWHDATLATKLGAGREFYFMVGNVPVRVDFHIDIFTGGDFNASGMLEMETGFRANASATLGVTYNNGQMKVIEPKFEQGIERVGPTLSGKGNIKGRLWYYPRFRFDIYGVTGPTFDLRPYVGLEAQGGFSKDLVSASSDDYFAHTMRAFWGVDVNMGWELADRGWGVDELWQSDYFNIYEGNIYETPTKVRFAQSNPKEVTPGAPMDVTVDVYDKLIGIEVHNSIIPVVVKFTGNGTVNPRFALTKGGKATTTWTPTSEDDYLRAEILDADGKVIDYDVFNGDRDDMGRKLLTSIDEYVQFEYDELGRVSKYVEDDEVEAYFSYNSDGVPSLRVNLDGDWMYITDVTLTGDGYLGSARMSDGEVDARLKCTYDKDGHLTKMEGRSDEESFTLTMNWKDGNVTKTRYSSEDESETTTYSYGKDENVRNAWPFFAYQNIMSFLMQNGYLGKGPQNFPSSVSLDIDGEKQNFKTSYKTDDEGYIIEEDIDYGGMYIPFVYHYDNYIMSRASQGFAPVPSGAMPKPLMRKLWRKHRK